MPSSSLSFSPEATAFLRTYIDDQGATTYIGKAAPGSDTNAPVWRLMRIQVVGSVTMVTYAGGTTGFVNTWDDRASLSYE